MRSRRNFLKSTSGAFAACLAGAGITSLLESCTSVKYISSVEKDGKLTVSKTELAEQLFVVVKSPSSPFPVYLVRSKQENSESGNENYEALLMRCTHKQCEVKPAGTVLYCPCHGSEFSASGKVLKEPASANLQKFIVTHDNQNIYIHLK